MLYGTVTDSMSEQFAPMSAEELVRWSVEEFDHGLVASTSFGIQSAVTLHLLHKIAPDTPVVWVDTGYLHDETYEYARTLTRMFDLNLQVYESPIRPRDMEVRFGRLWESDDVEQLNLYDKIRKVEPMQRALRELNATGWISGLRSDQTEYRMSLPRIKRDQSRYRIYPILGWSSRDVYYYTREHNLPEHPLFAKGYTTVGDAHSSRPTSAADRHERDTRFHGIKQECGLHL